MHTSVLESLVTASFYEKHAWLIIFNKHYYLLDVHVFSFIYVFVLFKVVNNSCQYNFSE